MLDATGEVVDFAKQVPVRINYTYRGKRYDKTPDAEDLQKIERLGYSDISTWFPVRRMCDGIESRRNDISGITHVHHFMTPRNLLIFSKNFLAPIHGFKSHCFYECNDELHKNL